MNNKRIYLFIVVVLMFISFLGCASNNNLVSLYPVNEPPWIREGQPLEFESVLWYPTDNIENLLDKEMVLMGTYNGVQVFTERRDIKPFKSVYTKFDEHQYRQFELEND